MLQTSRAMVVSYSLQTQTGEPSVNIQIFCSEVMQRSIHIGLGYSRFRLSLNSTGQTPTLTPTRTSSKSACPARAEVGTACRGARGPFSSPTCPRTFVRRALFLARMSVGHARVYTCTCTVHDKLSRLQNYTIGASLKSVSVSVPWNPAITRHAAKVYCVEKPAFHDADADILAKILADSSDTRDFLKSFLQQAERHADIYATILARISVSLSVSASWNAG